MKNISGVSIGMIDNIILLHKNKKSISRANKRNSTKNIIPLEYLKYKNNIIFVEYIISLMNKLNLSVYDVIYSMAINLLTAKGIVNNENVKKVFSEYKLKYIIEFEKINIPEDFDILGMVYQSLLTEGKKNQLGSYYTPYQVVFDMVGALKFSAEMKILDPCCGSGAFLISIDTDNPNNLYGCDIDEIAVFISKVNLLLKYHFDIDYIPNIFCINYIDNNLLSYCDIYNIKFDLVCTNPPWGAAVKLYNYIQEIHSNETFSYFFVRAYCNLKQGGNLKFLLPESSLKIKAHKDLRSFILNKCNVKCIKFYTNEFSGVVTSFISIDCTKDIPSQNITIHKDGKKINVDIEAFKKTENLIITPVEKHDNQILDKVRSLGEFSLENSLWALGIVTGDNKNKLHKVFLHGMERIYTGKEINRYKLSKEKNYIIFNRNKLQQVAKDEMYRAEEKLVYKFISNKLIFAYDNTKSLFLNSANILIPNIPYMSIKSVMAFLNSDLYQYFYYKTFGDIKILKGNLLQLRFPRITEDVDIQFSTLVDNILSGSESADYILQKKIYDLFLINEKEIKIIRSELYGNSF